MHLTNGILTEPVCVPRLLIGLLLSVVLPSLTELGLILIGYLVERHYVSRVTVFANALALNVHLLSLSEIPDGFALFADFAIGFRVVMLALYLFHKSASEGMYWLAMYPMSSVVIGSLIWSPLDPWYANLVLGILLQVAHTVSYNSLFQNRRLTYVGELSGQITRFVDDAQLEFVRNGIHWDVDLSLVKIETSPWWLKPKD